MLKDGRRLPIRRAEMLAIALLDHVLGVACDDGTIDYVRIEDIQRLMARRRRK